MKAIVTGATGFIGSWMVYELLNNSYEVLVIVRDKNKLIEEIKKLDNITIVEKDINELEISDIKAFYSADICYNFAWTGVNSNEKNSLSTQIKNIEMTMKLLEICNMVKCKKFISMGTVAEYALEDDEININNKPSPIDYYGAAKASTHLFVEIMAKRMGIQFNWIILSSTYGERRTDNNIISYTIKSLINNNTPQYGNLNKLWDFIYVGDAVRAIRLIGEKGRSNETYTVGSGERHTLRETVENIRNLINCDAKLQGFVDEKCLDTRSSCVNIDKLVRDTGFEAKVSFDQGIRKTIDWFINKSNLKG